jgi:prevent-host-death family protein
MKARESVKLSRAFSLTHLFRAAYHHVMPSQTVSIDEAKSQLSDLIATASEGGEVLIVENGKALARIIPATDSAIYKSHMPTAAEFSSDEESLAWDTDGWENVA